MGETHKSEDGDADVYDLVSRFVKSVVSYPTGEYAGKIPGARPRKLVHHISVLRLVLGCSCTIFIKRPMVLMDKEGGSITLIDLFSTTRLSHRICKPRSELR